MNTILNIPILEYRCGGEGVLQTTKLFLQLLNVVYIIVPIGLILMITIDFGKSVISSSEEDMKKNLSLSIKRIIFTLALFLIKPVALRAQVLLGNTVAKELGECLVIAEKTSDFSDYRANVQIDTSLLQAETYENESPKYKPGKNQYGSISVNSFLKALEKNSKQVEEDGNWIYNNDGIKGTLAAERDDDRGVSCAKMVSWALYDIGVYEKGSQGFFKCYNNCNYTNKIAWKSESTTKPAVEKYMQFVGFPDSDNKTKDLLKNNKLKKGDIILWYDHQHTSVYAGDGLWYDAGWRFGDHGYLSGETYHFKTFKTTTVAYPRIWGVYRWK